MSLTYEVAHIRLAVECARRTLADAEFVDGHPYQERRREAQAVLELVSARMKQLVTVLQGEADATSILAAHNASPASGDDTVLLVGRRTAA